jgi:hypothetical protein
VKARPPFCCWAFFWLFFFHVFLGASQFVGFSIDDEQAFIHPLYGDMVPKTLGLSWVVARWALIYG